MKNWNQDISYEKPVSEWMGFDHEIIGKMMINHGDVEGCIPTFRHSHNWKSSKVDFLEDENPPSRKKSHRICCWPVSRHPHPKGWGGPLATLKGCLAHLYRSCIPGAVRHWHRGIAGHGHGTDGGSTRHHIWRWGVDNLRSTWGQWVHKGVACMCCYINRWWPANAGTYLHNMGIKQVFILKWRYGKERTKSTTVFAVKKKEVLTLRWRLQHVLTTKGNDHLLCERSFTSQRIVFTEAFRQSQLKLSGYVTKLNGFGFDSLETITTLSHPPNRT